MKFIKDHIMFILPLVAILLGIEFFLVFDRMTASYEQRLRDGYSMLVVSKEPMTLQELQSINSNIGKSTKIEKNEILKEVSLGQNPQDTQEILNALPNFYIIKLAKYLDTSALDNLEKDLMASKKIKRVETFGNSYSSNYKLFSFIKFILKVFIIFMSVVSLFLVIKQMEVWGYVHRERMQVMEIFGAPIMLRSGILFKVAIVDALISTSIIVLFFLYLKYQLAGISEVDALMNNSELLFQPSDAFILLACAIVIVIISVYIVVFSSREKEA
ncbi:MAG: cell division protein FtsX [Sulfurovaceae bacterium]|nr:cell division protein FtsX [Sulfurovaceae bacterium]